MFFSFIIQLFPWTPSYYKIVLNYTESLFTYIIIFEEINIFVSCVKEDAIYVVWDALCFPRLGAKVILYQPWPFFHNTVILTVIFIVVFSWNTFVTKYYICKSVEHTLCNKKTETCHNDYLYTGHFKLSGLDERSNVAWLDHVMSPLSCLIGAQDTWGWW